MREELIQVSHEIYFSDAWWDIPNANSEINPVMFSTGVPELISIGLDSGDIREQLLWY